MWIALGVAAALLLALTAPPLRRAGLSGPGMGVLQRVMPRMSATEQAAIESGNVWWDAELFSGRPDWKRLLATPAPRLTDEEQVFLDVKADRLCDLSNDWDSTAVWQDLSPKARPRAGRADQGDHCAALARADGGDDHRPLSRTADRL